MALTKLEENLSIIEGLPDSPNLESGELKRKFDESSILIKKYINETLTEEMDAIVTQLKKDISNKILEDNKKKYYIGKLIFDTKNINPSTYLGFGTWQLWGSGRVPVGVNTNDANFNTVEKTGGSSTVNIAHTHTINGHTHTTGNHTLTTNEIPKHSHGYTKSDFNTTSKGWALGNGGTIQVYTTGLVNNTPTGSTGGGQAHNHGNTGSTSLTTNSGGNTNVNNLQPYITCYIWKRIS